MPQIFTNMEWLTVSVRCRPQRIRSIVGLAAYRSSRHGTTGRPRSDGATVGRRVRQAAHGRTAAVPGAPSPPRRADERRHHRARSADRGRGRRRGRQGRCDASGGGAARPAPLLRCTRTRSRRERELRHHFLWRFWSKIPGQGGMCVFDRSWYGRCSSSVSRASPPRNSGCGPTTRSSISRRASCVKA